MIAQNYRPEIDGIRAIAVLAVVGYHYSLINILMGRGFIGVDIFFVISGYLITQLLVKSNAENQKNWFKDFYFRRIRRIIPALILVLLGTLLAGLFILLPFELRQLGRQIFYGGLFSSNLFFWKEVGYFDPQAIQKPLLHLWSLGVEEQFYIVYPILIWIAIQLKIKIVRITTGITLFSSLVLMLLGMSNPATAYFSPITRMWELGIGGIASSIILGKPSKIHKFLRLFGILLFLSAFHFTSIDNSYPNWSALLPVVGTALILIFVRNEGPFSFILRSRLLVYIGKLSYSLYLWHWPIISLYVISEGHIPDRKVKYLLFAFSLFLSFISFKFVESPCRKLVLSNRNISIVLISLIAVSILGLVLSRGGGLPSRISSVNNSQESNKDVLHQFRTMNFANPDCLKDYPSEEAATYQWWFCRSNSRNPPEVLLWGDSYANQYFSGLSSSPFFSNSSLLSIGDCPIQRESELVPPNPCAGDLFDEQREFVKTLIDKEKSIRLVILAGLKEKADAQAMKDLSDAIEFLQSKKVQVVIFYPHIKPPEPIFGCIARPLRSAIWNCRLDDSDYRKLLNNFEPTRKMITARFQNIHIFNPNEAFCQDSGCSFMINGLPIIRDGSAHMSDWGSSLVAQVFERSLKLTDLARNRIRSFGSITMDWLLIKDLKLKIRWIK